MRLIYVVKRASMKDRPSPLLSQTIMHTVTALIYIMSNMYIHSFLVLTNLKKISENPKLFYSLKVCKPKKTTFSTAITNPYVWC